MESDPKTGMQASRPPLLLRQAVTDVGSTKCGHRTPPCLGQGFLIRLYTARWVEQLDDFPQMCAFLCTRLRGFPFCNNPSASFADTSPSQGRGGFILVAALLSLTPGIARQLPHRGGLGMVWLRIHLRAKEVFERIIRSRIQKLFAKNEPHGYSCGPEYVR